MAASITDLLASKPLDLAPYEDLYKHYHAHPELSNQEKETAATTAKYLSKLPDFKITTGIGGHGFAGVLSNGSGPTVLLRSDLDALPIKEVTNLRYASTARQVSERTGEDSPVMHACGHDMHITCLLAAAEHLSALRSSWSGTLIVLFQPAEERGTGAQAMVDDGLYDKNKHAIPVPDYVLGQHVMALPAGKIGSRVGTIMAAADSYKVTVFGRGGHGSMPHRTIDPVMMATNIVVRLQNIVSRETDPSDMAVLTVGYLRGGHTENIIVDHAELGIDIRTINTSTHDRVVASMKRIIHAEYIASGATKEPTIEHTRFFPQTDNDEDMEGKLANSFQDFFGDEFDPQIARTNASEDVSILASSQGKPSLFWFFGGVDPELWAQKEREGRLFEDIPQNHSSSFAPVIQPTLQTGVNALCVAALTFLGRKD
ncbi:hypothetical protein N0V90_008062 [Kalmusia sp. IMI 367209]|nr:hypothetical protein N0V90_008062 [Kalmusia sp. IMI 367209]